MLARHNARIGSLAQRLGQRTFFLLLFSIPAVLALRLLLRVQVRGEAHRRALRGPVIFVPRHYFEWDPAVPFYAGGVWLRALRHPNLVAVSVAGEWWFATRLRRVLAWLCGALVLERSGHAEPALVRAAALVLRRRGALSVAIYPTGPIGRAGAYAMQPGAAQLALACPDVPVVPVALDGLDAVRPRDVLLLRRPRVRIGFGAPFTARDIATACRTPVDDPAVAAAVSARIAAGWVGT